MDWTSIILAAIGGGVGGAVGSILGLVISRGRSGAVSSAVVAACAVLGWQFLPAYLEPHIGPEIRNLVGQSQEQSLGSEIEEVFETMPMFALLADRDPELVAATRARVIESYRENGLEAAYDTARAEGERLGAFAVSQYAPLADDASLLAFNQAIYELGQALQPTPRACYGFFFADLNPQAREFQAEVDVSQYVAFANMSEAMADLIRNSHSERPAFDPTRAAEVQAGMQQLLLEQYTADDLQFFAAAVPQEDAEFAVACEMMLVLLNYQIEHEDALHALRAGYAG